MDLIDQVGGMGGGGVGSNVFYIIKCFYIPICYGESTDVYTIMILLLPLYRYFKYIYG